MKNTKFNNGNSLGALLLRYLPPVLIVLTIGLLLTTALAHLSAREAEERNRKIVEAGLQFHLTLQRLTATLDPDYDPARADFAALALASKKFAASLEAMQRDLVRGSNAEALPRRLRDAVQRITDKQRVVDALTAQAENLGSVKKTLVSASDNFGALLIEIKNQSEGYDALAGSVSALNPKSLPMAEAESLGAAFRAAETGLSEAVEQLKTAPANAELQAAARQTLGPLALAAKAIAQKFGEFPAAKDAQALNRRFTAVAEAAERSAGSGDNAAQLAPDVDHAKIRVELRRARTELMMIGQQLPVVNEYFERFLDRPPVASLAELLFLVSGVSALLALGFAWRSSAKPPMAPAPALVVPSAGAREPQISTEALGDVAPLGPLPADDPFASAFATKDLFSAPDPFAAPDLFAAPEPFADTDPFASADSKGAGDDVAAALRELIVDVDRRLAAIAAGAEEDLRHVEELLSALGQSSQVAEQAALIETEMADAAQSLQTRAAEMRESLPAQGAMVRQVRESLIDFAAASAPTQAAGEILYALLDRLESMERTADGIDAQLNVGIDRLSKLPEGFGPLRSRATTLLEGARQLEQAYNEALIAVGGWRDEIVAIRTRLAEAVHA
jgi:uncharacterized phage infection (PIP) family protein YhgE